MGGARSLGRDVCQAIREVLATGAPPIVKLSRLAQAALRTLTDELPMSPGTNFVETRADPISARTWTFAGTRANRIFAHQLSVGGQMVRFDALSVYASIGLVAGLERADLTLNKAEIATFAESVKFAECVPHSLLTRTIVTRMFETP